MTIGPDIKEAIAEVGVKHTIIRDSGNINAGYLTFKSNEQVTKPFIREFFLEARMSYDTSVIVGDIIEFDTTSQRYRVMNLTPDLFENTIIRYNAVLYKTNVVATILRPTETRDPNSYRMETHWVPVKTSVDILLTTPLFGQDLETGEELGLLGIESHEMYAPVSYGIQALDRVKILNSTDYYRVDSVRERRYEAVDVIKVGQDMRMTSTTTTTFTSTSTTTTTA
jgi:hypothetical protein